MSKNHNSTAGLLKQKVSFFRKMVSWMVLALMILQNLLIVSIIEVKAAVPGLGSAIFINELHYDNNGVDSGEFVEIAGPAGTDLTNWSLVLYNGNGGASYNTKSLSGVVPAQQGGYGTLAFTYPVDGIQNGSPDGVALVNGTTLVQFLCYEGTFAATNGVASGQTCTDIGVTEPSTSTIGFSLQLQGSGTTYGNFTWAAPSQNTQGTINTGQTFTGGSGSTNPTGTGAANPNPVAAGGTTLLTVAVTPGTNPSSPITSVSGDLTAIGGSATQPFFDDGTNGDAAPGDNVFSYNTAVSNATTAGSKSLPVTITDALARTGTVSIALVVTSSATPPSVAGAANPNSLMAGSSTLLTAAVTAGTNPTSTGLVVTGDLTTIGGSATQTFFDDGTNGDVTAGDNVFSFTATIAAGTAPGNKNLPVTVADAQLRTGNMTIALTVTQPPLTAQPLPFSQNWSNTNLITTNGDWSSVPGIIGYRGDNLTPNTGTDPQTILAEGSTTPVDITANSTTPNTLTSGGIYEFEIANPVVAFQGSGTADAPHVVINLNTTGKDNITVFYNLRDIESSIDNAVQPVALQYRVGNTGDYTNVPAAFVADATTGPNEATLVTPIAVVLPAAVSNQPLVQLRIITANAVGNDEFVGVDDIFIDSNGTIPLSGAGSANPGQVESGAATLLKVSVNPATNPASTGITVIGNLTTIGGSATQAFFDDGTNGDTVAGDNIFSFAATVPSNSSGGSRTLPVTITDAQSRTASTSISLTVIAAADPQEHLVMGNPSGATPDVNNPFNYLLPKNQYVMSYHRDRAIPNWVSWHLDSSWIGAANRQDDFRPDPSLPADWYHVKETDYSGSGFDRGHHTPSADRTRSIPDNSATFLMTNMMPQAPGNNQGPWEKLESYGRTLVGQGSELYILGAGVGVGGTGRTQNGPLVYAETIANGQVTVPSYTWKVILVLPVGDDDVARVTANTRTIAVIMPNHDDIRPDSWQKYLATVDQVEALTGYNFFSNVPPNIQAVIESRLDPESNAAAPQTVAGGTYTNLDVTSTPNKSLTGNITVTGNLNLGGTILATSNFCVTLGANATVTHGSGYVNGCVERQFDTVAAAVEYPVGTQNGFSPVMIAVTALGQSSKLAVRAVEGVQPNVADPTLALKRYWTLTETGDLTANLTFKYLDIDVPAGVSENSLTLQRYEGGFTTIPATIDPNANTATANDISQFSDWTLIALAPTAATVTVSGRVHLPERGLTGARVTLTDSQGNSRSVSSGKSGSFRFTNVMAGETYIISVKFKRYSFAPQVVTVTEDITDLDFFPLN